MNFNTCVNELLTNYSVHYNKRFALKARIFHSKPFHCCSLVRLYFVCGVNSIVFFLFLYFVCPLCSLVFVWVIHMNVLFCWIYFFTWISSDHSDWFRLTVFSYQYLVPDVFRYLLLVDFVYFCISFYESKHLVLFEKDVYEMK